MRLPAGPADLPDNKSSAPFEAVGIPYFGIGASAFGAFVECGWCGDNLAICLRIIKELEATTDEDIAAWSARAAAADAA